MANRLELIWGGEVVGFVEDPKSDMFHLYGKWVPANSGKTEEFLAALVASDGGDVEAVPVLVGGNEPKLVGEASLYLGDQINVLVRPPS